MKFNIPWLISGLVTFAVAVVASNIIYIYIQVLNAQNVQYFDTVSLNCWIINLRFCYLPSKPPQWKQNGIELGNFAKQEN